MSKQEEEMTGKPHDTESLVEGVRDWVKKLQEKGYECSEVAMSCGDSENSWPDEITATIKFKRKR